jgi:hypothetical protein
MEDEIGDGIVGDDEVEPAIVVEVDWSDAEGFGEGQAGGAVTTLDAAWLRHR